MRIWTIIPILCFVIWWLFVPPTSAIYIPDPEEIYQAFNDGFIDYTDYIALLEISRAWHHARDDSLYLPYYPNLLIGVTANPHLIFKEEPRPTSQPADIKAPFWQPSFLYRQYQRLTEGNNQKRLYRAGVSYHDLTFYGEFDQLYSGSRRWCRRLMEYCAEDDSGRVVRITLGNYRGRFGLGLIYGYHGQLFSRTGSADDMNGLLYSRYGGSNGLYIFREIRQGPCIIVYDRDQCPEFGKDFWGLSLPFLPELQISAAYGRLRNRLSGAVVESKMVSGYVELTFGRWQSQFELAAANQSNRILTAAAIDLSERKGRKISFRLTGWTYDSDYPAWFSGGPSSRRYQTLRLDEIDFSYSDRFSGETGLTIKSRFTLFTNWSLYSAAGYAWRDINDNRAEWRAGAIYRSGGLYQIKFDCYWRADDLYSTQRSQRRPQVEVILQSGPIRSRFAFGHRFDRIGRRNDYIVYLENRLDNRIGRIKLMIKIDRLHFGNLQNNYMYIAIAYEATINHNLRSYIKFTRRYYRGEPGNSYGELRWDINWGVQ